LPRIQRAQAEPWAIGRIPGDLHNSARLNALFVGAEFFILAS
jgi:hypothetical protein